MASRKTTGNSKVNCSEILQKVADKVHAAEALIITAGAGMSVDSGLPDYRGKEGFWKAYPLLKKKDMNLQQICNPEWFVRDPQFAWGFFGHCYGLYKNTQPHRGYQILKKWAAQKDNEYFVFTSNIDGHFLKAGFDPDRVLEIHGSMHYLQCIGKKNTQIWPVPDNVIFDIDEENLRLKSPLPMGPPGINDTLARPNVAMFDDWEYKGDRTNEQHDRLSKFQTELGNKANVSLVIIEIGAGLGIEVVRHTSEWYAHEYKLATLIRINPNEPQVPDGNISVPMKGLAALRAIDNILKDK